MNASAPQPHVLLANKFAFEAPKFGIARVILSKLLGALHGSPVPCTHAREGDVDIITVVFGVDNFGTRRLRMGDNQRCY